MKLIKFRIRNYKSIKDSGWCWLASDLTTLAGKNESGKTAILEALRDFDIGANIPDSAVPLDDSGDPEIEMYFMPGKRLIETVASESPYKNIDHSALIIDWETNGITIKKSKEEYTLPDNRFLDAMNARIEVQNVALLEGIVIRINNFRDANPDLPLPEVEVSGPPVTDFKPSLELWAAKVKLLAQKPAQPDQKPKYEELIRMFQEGISEVDLTPPSDVIMKLVTRNLPKIIFFSDFVDILPFESKFADALAHSTIQDFAKVANIDMPKVVATRDLQRRRNLLRDRTATISGDFLSYWTQDKINLVAEPDGDILRIGIEEDGKTKIFKAEQRSKGFQWFLSFYIRLNASRSSSNILLLDEPGLYLHAKAQKDVLKVLERISQESQVIFCTHSPYLIDVDRLDRVKLVIKNDKEGTRIENKIHKSADTDTLTPIVTAIGLDLSSKFSVAGENNLILEGPSDYFYIQAMRELLHPKEKSWSTMNLIPCMGARKIPQIVSIMIGWNLKFVALLDNDREGTETKEELINKLAVDEGKIVLVSDQSDQSIEDLFSKDDFRKLILDGDPPKAQPEASNSRYIKDQKMDKVLLAKKFLDRVHGETSKIKLAEETKKTFSEMLFRVRNSFATQ